MNRTKMARAIAALVALAGALMGVALAPASQAQTGGQEVATTIGKAVGGSRVIETANGAVPGLTLPDLTVADAEALVAAAQAGDRAAGVAVLEGAGFDIQAVARATGAAQPQAVVNSAGPAPTVELPSTGGGPFVETLASLDLTSPDPDGTTLATDLEVGTEGQLGPDGFAESAAHLENVNRPEPNGEERAASAGARPLQEFGVDGYYQADAVDSECRADADGVTATTTITNGQPRDDFFFTALLGVATIPTNPSPNQTLGALDLSLPIDEGLFFTIEGFLIANEQTRSGPTLMVNATHGLLAFSFTGVDEGGTPIELTLFSSETVYGTVHCGVTLTEGDQAPAARGPVAARPTFTG